MSVKVVHIPVIGEVTFMQNPRSKRIRLSVKTGPKTVVSFPLFVSYREAVRFAEQHAGWIMKQNQKLETSLPKFSENSALQTRFHKISFRKNGKKFEVQQRCNDFEIIVPEANSFSDQKTQQYLHMVLTAIYRQEAKQYLPPRLSEMAKRYGFQYGNLTIRNNKTNWGSCSGRNNISLNLNLMRLPDHLVDYVLLHELVHLKVKNHSPVFWQTLDGLTGNQARKLTAELKKYRTYTI